MSRPMNHQVTPRRSWAGWLLVGVGLLALAANLSWLDAVSNRVWSAFLLFGGTGLAALGFRDQERWWTLIPAGALIGGRLAMVTPEAWSGLALLGSLGVGFMVVATRGKNLWWALIPGSALLGLALVTVNPGVAGAGWLFLGTALVALGSTRRRWAFIPAAGLLVPWLAVMGSRPLLPRSGRWR